MTSDVKSVQQDTSLVEVINLMKSHRLSCLVVCEGDQPIGIISERDIVMALSKFLEDSVTAPKAASEVMSVPLITVSQNTLVIQTMEMFNSKRIRRVAVTENGNNKIVGIVTQSDILKIYLTELEHQVHHDSLTHLPNRLLFIDRLKQAMARPQWHNRLVGLIFLDLDHFKRVNDSLGHSAGDLLLIAVAERLSSGLREGDTVARFGGDEFAIILADVAQIQDIARISQKIISIFTKPFKVENQEIFATVSMGISICPSDGKDVETLLRKTDIAMYQSKERGRNNYRFYFSEMNTKVSEWLSLDAALHHAVDQDEFSLYYQPRVNLNSGQIVGTEALIRWNHPNLGFVPPLQFIPIAEETGLIEPIGKWVLFTACTTGKAWQDAGYKDIQVSVNLSARQFHQKDLVKTIEKILKKTSFDPHSLELELTESMLMNMDLVLSPLQKLFDMGIQISIDDFGTGFSSLSYLKKLPITKVKIDQSFVREIVTDPSDAAIVRAIVTMAHHLNLKVTAEGVETGEQLEFLHALDCDEIQGYVFSPALPIEKITNLLAQKKSL